DRVVTWAATDHVVAAPTHDRVVPSQPDDHVGPFRPAQVIRSRCPHDGRTHPRAARCRKAGSDGKPEDHKQDGDTANERRRGFTDRHGGPFYSPKSPGAHGEPYDLYRRTTGAR